MDIKTLISNITPVLTNNIPSEHYSSLYLGKSGHLLFELAKQEYSNLHVIESTIESVLYDIENSENLNFSFCVGISGTVWLTNYLKKRNIISIDDDIFYEIYPALALTANSYLENSFYDFLHGAGGPILALLQDVEKNRQSLEYLTKKLLSVRIKFNGFNVWKYIGRSVVSEFEISLGLSHGLPSMMVLLSKLYSNGILQTECKDAIDECYKFIQHIKNPRINEDNYSYYPTMVSEANDLDYRARMAWCYGDLGVASALYTTGITTKNNAMVDDAVKIYLYYATLRMGKKHFGVIDAEFCHGSAGLTHLFYRMYYNTKIETLKNAANYWSDIAIKMAVHKDGILNYKFFSGDEGWKNDISLLNGIAGIGTALATNYYNSNPDWDECFLLS